MLDCLIVGDSIAVGLHTQMTECHAIAKGGLSSWQYRKQLLDKAPLEARKIIISLGSNDHQFINTDREIHKIRNHFKAKKVFWILPAGNLQAGGVPISHIQGKINRIAYEYGDGVIVIEHLQKDGIHPSGRGYQKLAEILKGH
jgi:lysophospholipase L1-like esterase